MQRTQVLIIDDAVAIRRLLSESLALDPDLEVVGAAANGRIGLALIQRLNPGVVILDLEMPEMHGLEVLVQIRAAYPRLPVIIFSVSTARGAVATLDALTLGADDYVTKPTSVDGPGAAERVIRDQLAPRIKLFGRRDSSPKPSPPTIPSPKPHARQVSPTPEVVVIGISTGGPNALAVLIPQLPADFPAPILIVQHMPPIFTQMLAERLNSASAISVSEAFSGQVVRPGQAVIAPGDWHMVAERHGEGVRVLTHQEHPENSCRPAVDVLFRSAAQMFGSASLGVIMTGMGQDGLAGSEEIRRAGGQILAQDEASSVVWGMPGYVVRAGLADFVLPLDQLALEIIRKAQANSGRDSLLQRRSQAKAVHSYSSSDGDDGR